MMLLRSDNPGFAPIAVVTLAVFGLMVVRALIVSRLTRGKVVREAAWADAWADEATGA